MILFSADEIFKTTFYASDLFEPDCFHEISFQEFNDCCVSFSNLFSLKYEFKSDSTITYFLDSDGVVQFYTVRTL